MRRFLSWILLIIVVLQSYGFLVFHHFATTVYYPNEAARKIAEHREELVWLHLPIAVVQQEVVYVKPHEIRFREQMYDIAEQFERGDTLHLLAYADHDESHWYTALVHFFAPEEKSSPLSLPAAQTLAKWWQVIYLVATATDGLAAINMVKEHPVVVYHFAVSLYLLPPCPLHRPN